jgi:RNA polymerase sigma-70 factor, ECF subfamily
MLLNEARRPARLDAQGELVLLEDQDRSLWRADQIAEGRVLLQQSAATGAVGAYTLQAAISATHAAANTVERTDWVRIVSLYDALLELTGSPVVALNRAVAVSMRDGPGAGLTLLAPLHGDKQLQQYHPLHVVEAELQRKAGDFPAARAAYKRALDLVQQEPERRHLQRRLASL